MQNSLASGKRSFTTKNAQMFYLFVNLFIYCMDEAFISLVSNWYLFLK